MAENKTKATAASVSDHIERVASEEQKADCQALITLMRKVTRAEPTMWGPSIIGFGKYRYKYESGREGESCVAGFAVRGKDIVAYLMMEDAEQAALLAKLGKHKMGKACLYFRRLSDLDAAVLERLVVNSVAAVKQRYEVVKGA